MEYKKTCMRCGCGNDDAEVITKYVGDESYDMCEICRDDMGL